jgi:ATP-dependent DNA helicase PIF1
LPQVKFTNGKILVIGRKIWKKVEGYDKNGKLIVASTRKQIPLILSWAITIHKSQGQSIERLKVDLSKCFLAEQVYVALSRITNHKYLHIVNSPQKKLSCNYKAHKFYQLIKQKGIFISDQNQLSKYFT